MDSKEIEKLVKETKKQLTIEQIEQAIRQNTYGGVKPVNTSLKGGVKLASRTLP